VVVPAAVYHAGKVSQQGAQHPLALPQRRLRTFAVGDFVQDAVHHALALNGDGNPPGLHVDDATVETDILLLHGRKLLPMNHYGFNPPAHFIQILGVQKLQQGSIHHFLGTFCTQHRAGRRVGMRDDVPVMEEQGRGGFREKQTVPLLTLRQGHFAQFARRDVQHDAFITPDLAVFVVNGARAVGNPNLRSVLPAGLEFEVLDRSLFAEHPHIAHPVLGVHVVLFGDIRYGGDQLFRGCVAQHSGE